MVAGPADSDADRVRLAAGDESAVGCVVGNIIADGDGNVDEEDVGNETEGYVVDMFGEVDEADEAAAEFTWLPLKEVSSIM